mgnify:FL=1
MTLTFRAPWCKSLKDKRSLVKRLVMGLRHQFNASVCESGHQQTLTLMEIQLAMLAFDRAQADSMGEQVLRFVERVTEAEWVDSQLEMR